MSISIINKTLQSTSREAIRREVINRFLDEQCGTGKKEKASKYIYIVEQYKDKKIILKRPASLNRGFDFEVIIETLYFKSKKRKHKNPTHADIVNALKKAKYKNERIFNLKIKPLLIDTYQCNTICLSNDTILSFIDDFNNDEPIEIIILALKWLFIEQDITYWNRSGRQMLYEALSKSNLI